MFWSIQWNVFPCCKTGFSQHQLATMYQHVQERLVPTTVHCAVKVHEKAAAYLSIYVDMQFTTLHHRDIEFLMCLLCSLQKTSGCSVEQIWGICMQICMEEAFGNKDSSDRKSYHVEWKVAIRNVISSSRGVNSLEVVKKVGRAFSLATTSCLISSPLKSQNSAISLQFLKLPQISVSLQRPCLHDM